MRKILTLILLLISIYSFSQDRVGILRHDSMVCCRVIRGATELAEIPYESVIYTGFLQADSIDGYPRFVWSIVTSTDGIKWNVVQSHTDTITMVNFEYEDGFGDDDDSWDTSVVETTSIAAKYLGWQVETIDSSQAVKLKGDLIIRPK